MHEITRAEAEQALHKLGVPRDMGGKYHILEVLEALGLIKFKPEPLSRRDRFKLHMNNLGYHEKSIGLQEALAAYDSVAT